MTAATRTQKLTQTAVLTAITILLALTPLGYIPINPLITITIMVTPVVIGGLLCGWPYGLFLGLVFGLSSFFRAPYEPIGQIILSQSALITFLVCVIPRMTVGLLGGLGHALACKREVLNRFWFFLITGLLGSLLNTVGVLGFIGLAFDPGKTGITGAVIFGIVSINGSIEAVANAFLVGTLGKALQRFTQILKTRK